MWNAFLVFIGVRDEPDPTPEEMREELLRDAEIELIRLEAERDRIAAEIAGYRTRIKRLRRETAQPLPHHVSPINRKLAG